MEMITLRSPECGLNYFEKHLRYVRSDEQTSYEKYISEQLTDSCDSNYYTTDIHQQTRKPIDLQTNLLLEFQLLQPNGNFYEQLLQTVLSTIHEGALAKPAMLDFCLQLYVNHNTLVDIRKFAKNYQVEDSINWYTKESFVYRCINQTLRFGDIDKCYSLRFYIADLSAQLYTLKCQQQKPLEEREMTILYRGFRQSDEELNILQSLVGRFVAIKSFMSTSRDKNIALTYASPSDGQGENSRPILLEIHVDLSCPGIIAADITGISNFKEECEVLFNIGSIFRIDMLTLDAPNDIWLCRFTATNENPACVQEFQIIPYNISLPQLMLYGSETDCPKMIQHEQRDSNSKTSVKSLSNDRQKLSWIAYKAIDWGYLRHIDCLIQWQQTDINKLRDTCERVLEMYAQVDVKDSFDDLQIATCINNYGYLNILCGKNTQLIDLFKSSLNIRKKYLPDDDILLAQSYRNLGLAHSMLGDYHAAFELHERALSINQHACLAAQWSTVTTLRNMGDLCHRSRNITKAMEYYLKGIDTYHKCLNFFDSAESEQWSDV